MQWRSLKEDNGTGRETGAAYEIIKEPVQPCAFCRGKGEKPAGSQCSVCRGKGTVQIRPPAVKCALCKGRGEERPRGNVTCNACRGKGFVTVAPPIQKCASCRGTGRQRGSRLACITCHGAGVVSVNPQETRAAATSRGGPTPRPAFAFRIGEQPSIGGRKAAVASAAARRAPAGSTAGADPGASGGTLASELEILRLYARASLGERVVLSKAARRTPAYVKLLQKSLVKKGLLRHAGSRRLQITDHGLQAVRIRGGVETVKDGDKPAAPESPKKDQADRPPADALKVPAPAPMPSTTRGIGLRWTVLSGV